MNKTRTHATGLMFGEGPRWHDGRLWVSDFRRKQVLTVDLDGRIEVVVDVSNQPSGLGWLPDGRLLIVLMVDQKVVRLENGGLVEHADLGGIAIGRCNDMVVDADGRAYVGNFGFDVLEYTGRRLVTETMREDPNFFLADPNLPTATLARVDPDGSVTAAADGLRFPNGTVITPDGKTLIVAEMFDPCLTAFNVAPDGSLSNRRVWAQFARRYPTIYPDGICLDAEGAIWVANPIAPECVRVGEGGVILDRIETDAHCYACMLGGADRRTLFMITNAVVNGEPRCQIEVAEVDAPGVGYP